MNYRYKFYILLILLIVCSHKIYAQTTEALITAAEKYESLGKHKEAETVLLKIKAQLSSNKNATYSYVAAKHAFNAAKIKPESAEQILTTAINEIKQISQSPQSADALLQIYIYYLEIIVAKEEWEKALQTALEAEKIYNIKTAARYYKDLIGKIAYLYDYNGDIYKAIEYYEKAIQLYETSAIKNNDELALNYNNLAFAYDAIGQSNIKIKYYKKAFDLWDRCCEQSIHNVVTGAANLVEANIVYGNIKDAKYYVDYLKKYDQKIIDKKYKSVFNSFKEVKRIEIKACIQLAYIRYFAEVFDEQQLLFHLNQMEKIFTDKIRKDHRPSLSYLMTAYEEVGFAYKVQKNYNKATAYYKKLENEKLNIFYEMKAAANLAIAYNETPQTDSAIKYNEAALEAFKIKKMGGSSVYSLTILRAELQAKKNLFKQSEETILELYSKLKEKKYTTAFEITDDELKNYNNSNYLEILIRTGNVYKMLYENSGNEKYIQPANHFYKLSAVMFGRYYDNGFYNKKLWSDYKRISEGLLYTSVLMKPEEETLRNDINLLENNSSQHLWQKFADRYSENLNLPSGTINKKNLLVSKQSYLHSKEHKTKEDSTELLSVQKQLKEFEKQIDQKDERIKTFSERDFDIKNLMKKLNPEELIIKYQINNENVYAFIITNKQNLVYKLANADSLKRESEKYYKQLKNIDAAYIQTSTNLYKALITPLQIEGKYKKLVIVPEDFLNFLPFETLVNEKNEPLVLNKNVSYSYSLKLLLHQKENSSSTGNINVAAFAPAYKKFSSAGEMLAVRSNNLYDLASAKKEAETIVNLFNGKYYKDTTATKNNFIQNLASYNVHHLAMHAVVNNDNYEESALIFQNNESLSFSQLYNLNFPSSMVVLSACNTGMGAMENGEGMMSLSRALVYSGVQSSVYSLWEVPDNETSEIMIAFYKYLNEGDAKDAALAKAKKDFIKANPMKSHPYYWAGFVVNGNTEPIKKSYLIWYILAGSVVLLGVFFFYRKKILPKFFK